MQGSAFILVALNTRCIAEKRLERARKGDRLAIVLYELWNKVRMDK